MLLLPLLKKAVVTTNNGDARVIVTSSSLHLVCRKLNLDLLTSSSSVKWPALYDAVWRYARSKLGNILFTKELNRHLLQDRDPASKHIYVNSYFPGNIVTDQWLAWSAYVGKPIGSIIGKLGSMFGQSLEDGAATAMYLAASKDVRDKNYRGLYFIPIAAPCEPSSLGRDMKLARDVWVSYGLLVSVRRRSSPRPSRVFRTGSMPKRLKPWDRSGAASESAFHISLDLLEDACRCKCQRHHPNTRSTGKKRLFTIVEQRRGIVALQAEPS